jgi:hypothetical protein
MPKMLFRSACFNDILNSGFIRHPEGNQAKQLRALLNLYSDEISDDAIVEGGGHKSADESSEEED